MKANRFGQSESAQVDSLAVRASVVSRLVGAHRGVAVSAGLCLPKGKLADAKLFSVCPYSVADTAQNLIPEGIVAQAEVLNRWSDGSIRWVLADFVLPQLNHPIDSSSRLNDNVSLDLPVTLTPVSDAEVAALTDDEVTESNLTKARFVDGELILTSRRVVNASPSIDTLKIRPVLRLVDNETAEWVCLGIREERTGPVRRIMNVRLRLSSMPFVTLCLRLTHWCTTGIWQAESRLRNSRRAQHIGGLWDLGDAGSFRFRSLHLQITTDDSRSASTLHWKCERQHSFSVCSLPAGAVKEPDAAELLSIRQYGSGGSNWNSRNHVDANEICEVACRGYVVRTPSSQIEGSRAEPVVAICSPASHFAVSVPEFWQQFPGSISAGSDCISVGLFPLNERLTAETGAMLHELQGGEQKTRTLWISQQAAQPDENILDWTFDRPRLLQSPQSIQEAQVFPWFPGAVSQRTDAAVTASPLPDDHRRISRYLQQATSGDFSLHSRREKIDEYGWRNYGDVPADHEQTHFAGPGTIVSHYNNQFDMIYGGIVQLAATSDLKWLDLLEPLALHVMDIDIYHTAQDRAVFNGGLFWHTDHYVDACTSTHRTYSRRNQKPGCSYGGGPGCEHNYTTGLLYYFFMTGNPEARDSVLSLAEWVIQMDDGRNTVFGLLDDGPTGHASSTVLDDFHGPGRGPGNSINSLIDAWLLTGTQRYMVKAEELIQRCVHPRQNLTELHLDDAEGHWSYTVFLNSLGRYLLVKQEADQLDGMYAYARDVMIHYGRWMAVHAESALNHPERLEYPTEAWAAQEFRKANVLRVAACCEDDFRMALLMRDKARELNNQAWIDLYAFENAHLTARCLSILMTEGQRDLYHRTAVPAVIPPGLTAYPHSEWNMFIPQKARVRLLLKSPKRMLFAVLKGLHPRRILRTLKALRKQF